MKNTFTTITTFLVVSLFFYVGSAKAQISVPIPEINDSEDRNWAINNLLDSLLNKSNINTGIICVTQNAITIDTLVIGKVKRFDADSVTVGKFLKKNQKKISSKEFWGVIASNGDCRRFHNKEMYLIWETPSPYIYRFQETMGVSYYFSETLLSPLYSLDRNTIANTPLSPEKRDLLVKALEDRERAEQLRIRENREMIAEVSLNVLNILFQIMVCTAIDNYHPTQAPRPKQTTGPRNSRGSVRH